MEMDAVLLSLFCIEWLRNSSLTRGLGHRNLAGHNVWFKV